MMQRGVTFVWDAEAEAFRPTPRFLKHANETFVDTEMYRFDIVEERSLASHNHFFAALHDLWLNLPDHLAIQFPTEAILRKHALIMSGFRRERKFAMSTKEDARKLAAGLRPQTIEDDYAIISVAGTVVVEWKAMSQSYKAMPEKGQFQRSKEAVLGFARDLIGVKEPA